MSAKAVLSPRPNSFKFSERHLNLEVPIKIGRAFKNEKSSPENAYFDCKVLSKAHAMLLYEDGKFMLVDTGSSNGTFVNNIRLSKASTESEMTEIFTGDILRFGSDVVDKSRNVTQKCVIMKISLVHPDGEMQSKRPSSSRLYKPSDSYEDLSIVTNNLQTALTREKYLEDKLILFKNLIKKHSENLDYSLLIKDLQSALKDEDISLPEKIHFDEMKLDKLMKENKELVLKCKEYDIKLKSKESHCSNLQLKATEDAQHITNLGNIIDKLRTDISNLETVVNNVKNTQQKVRDEYEETLMNQRKMFDEEIEELVSQHNKTTEKLKKMHNDEKSKLEQQLHHLKESGPGEILGGTIKDAARCIEQFSHCWSSCSSVPNTPSPYPVARSSSQSTNLSCISSASSTKTVLAALNKVVQNKEELEGEEFDIAEDLEKSMDIFNGMLKAKDEEIEVLNTKVLELQNDLQFQDEKDKDFEVLQRLAEDEADTIRSLEKENLKLLDAISDMEEQVKADKKKVASMEESVLKEREKVWGQLNSTVDQVESQRKKYQELQTMLTEARDDIIKLEEENSRLKDQAISKWVDAAESDFDCLFQVEMNGKKTSNENDTEKKQIITEEAVKEENKTEVNIIKTDSTEEKSMKELSHLQQNKWKYISVFVLLVAVISASFWK